MYVGVQTAAEGLTAEEGKQINKSLSALGNVRLPSSGTQFDFAFTQLPCLTSLIKKHVYLYLRSFNLKNARPYLYMYKGNTTVCRHVRGRLSNQPVLLYRVKGMGLYPAVYLQAILLSMRCSCVSLPVSL